MYVRRELVQARASYGTRSQGADPRTLGKSIKRLLFNIVDRISQLAYSMPGYFQSHEKARR